MQALLDAPMFEVRFRHVATRALSIMRSMQGRKVPAWIQRLRTQELITALFPQRNACFENRPPAIEVPDHFIVGETVRECLERDRRRRQLEQVMRGLEDRFDQARVFVDSVAPSVFAHRILLAWDYSFLDDGERANRRSRTVTMNRGWPKTCFAMRTSRRCLRRRQSPKSSDSSMAVVRRARVRLMNGTNWCAITAR